jgi:hypothetical protein
MIRSYLGGFYIAAATLMIVCTNNFASAAIQIVGNSGDDLAFGNVRVGTSSTLNLSVKRTGPPNGAQLSGTFATAGGEFSTSGGLNFGPMGNAGAPVRHAYTYTPVNLGTDSLTSFVTNIIDNGSPLANRPVVLSGSGVAPTFNSYVTTPGGTIDFGTVTAGSGAFDVLTLFNDTNAGNLGALTDLSILSFSISGPNALDFSVTGFSPTVLSELVSNPTETLPLTINLLNSATPGLKSAVLTFNTDQNAALGGDGLDFSYNLVANVTVAAVPEPATGLIWGGLAVAGMLGYRRSKRNVAAK